MAPKCPIIFQFIASWSLVSASVIDFRKKGAWCGKTIFSKEIRDKTTFKFYFCSEITFQFTKEYSTLSSSVSIFVHAFILKKSLANFHFRLFPPVKSVIDLEGQGVSFPGLGESFRSRCHVENQIIRMRTRCEECHAWKKRWAGGKKLN